METLKVEQCDRDAAYGAYFECYEDTPNDLWLEALRAGKHDDDPQVQVIAAVRIAERERNAGIAESHRDKPEWHVAAKNGAKLIEPVAWMYEDENGSVVLYRNRVPLPGFVIETPLYTAAAINEAVQKERAGNYKSFTDGMEAAAQICGSLAETTYDDADAFEAAIGCEAAIMRVVMAQRREQAAIEAHKESQHGDA